MDFLSGFGDELEKLADGTKQKFVDSPSAAMLAEHVPFGGALLSWARGGNKGPKQPLKQRLMNAAKTEGLSYAGGMAGAAAGLGAGKLIEHGLKAHGRAAPGWLTPALVGVGGLAAAPIMHKASHR